MKSCETCFYNVTCVLVSAHSDLIIILFDFFAKNKAHIDTFVTRFYFTLLHKNDFMPWFLPLGKKTLLHRPNQVTNAKLVVDVAVLHYLSQIKALSRKQHIYLNLDDLSVKLLIYCK